MSPPCNQVRTPMRYTARSPKLRPRNNKDAANTAAVASTETTTTQPIPTPRSHPTTRSPRPASLTLTTSPSPGTIASAITPFPAACRKSTLVEDRATVPAPPLAVATARACAARSAE